MAGRFNIGKRQAITRFVPSSSGPTLKTPSWSDFHMAVQPYAKGRFPEITHGRGFNLTSPGMTTNVVDNVQFPAGVTSGGRLQENNVVDWAGISATVHCRANPFLELIPEATFTMGTPIFVTRHDGTDVGGELVLTLSMANVLLRAGHERMKLNILRLVDLNRMETTGNTTYPSRLNIQQYMGLGEFHNNRVPIRDPHVGIFEQMFTVEDVVSAINLVGLFQSDNLSSHTRTNKIYENAEVHKYKRFVVYRAEGVERNVPNLGLGEKFDKVFVTLTRDQMPKGPYDDLDFNNWGPYQFRVTTSCRSMPLMRADSINVQRTMALLIKKQEVEGYTPRNKIVNALFAPALTDERLGYDDNPTEASIGHWNLCFDVLKDDNNTVKMAQQWEYPPVWRLGTLIDITAGFNYYSSATVLENFYKEPREDITIKHILPFDCDLHVNIGRVV